MLWPSRCQAEVSGEAPTREECDADPSPDDQRDVVSLMSLA